MNLFLWSVYPYLSLAVLVIASLYRYDADPLTWTAKSSQILEKRRLRWGSLLFHWGIVFVFLGHVGGLLVPINVYHTLRVPDEAYHLAAIIVGGMAGLAAISGLVLLLLRRLQVERVWKHTTASDLIALGLLLLTVGLGISMTLGYNLAITRYEYRTTVGAWVRSLLILHPNPSLLADVPLLLKIHLISAFTLFAISPFTRLVHIWSLPLSYVRRAPIQYRRRVPAPAKGKAAAHGRAHRTRSV